MHMVINIAYFIIVNIKSVLKISDTHLMLLMNFLMHPLRHILFWNLRCMKGDCNRKVLWPDVNFFEKNVFIFYVHEYFCLHECMCYTCVLGTHRGQKRLSDPLGL